jgi:hypothetical protein
VINSKFSRLWSGCSNEPLGSYGARVLKNIRWDWRKFSSHTRFEVGDSTKIGFWNDLWCEHKALKEAIPNLYGIACVKEASVTAHFFLVAPISGT